MNMILNLFLGQTYKIHFENFYKKISEYHYNMLFLTRDKKMNMLYKFKFN